MASLDLQSLTKSYGENRVVADVSLHVEQGEFLVLLGPSGCGKTTTLRMIAGFVEPSSGHILIGGKDITTLPPWRRNCGMVFQNYALFPHLTVAENVAFGLQMRKVETLEQHKRVKDALTMVRLEHLAGRYPREMSGGQQQRVALARALAIEPDILLLDEPLSNLDAKLREEVRVEIRELQRKLGLTTILVTHDQEEALTVADRLVVMNGGHVCQIGDKRDLYERPADRFVASFIGRSSFIEGHIKGQGLFESADGLQLKVSREINHGPATLAIRPERCRLGASAQTCENQLTGQVEFVSYLGSALDIHVRLGTQTKIIVQLSNQGSVQEPQLGETVQIGWASTAGLLYPSDQGRQSYGGL
jgi:putative spermidine/putrescine transport system ATP-binding protein